MPAQRQSAARVSSPTARAVPRMARRTGLWSARGGLRGRRPAPRGARTRSTRRASSRRAGSRRGRPCRRTRRGVEAREARAPVAVGDDSPDHVMRRRRDRNRDPAADRTRPRSGHPMMFGKPVRLDLAHVEHHGVRPLRSSSSWIARATSSRGASSSTKRSPSAVKSSAPSPLTASLIEEAVQRALRDQRGWMELEQLEVGELGAGSVRQQESAADRAARVRRAFPERGRATGRKQSGRARASRRRSSRHRRSGRLATRRRSAEHALVHVDPLVSDSRLGERLRDSPSRRASAGVHDSPARVPAFESEQSARLQRPCRNRCRGRAARARVRAPPRRACRAALSLTLRRARRERVFQMERRCCRRNRARRRGRPAPGSRPTGRAASWTPAGQRRPASAATSAA